MYICVCNAITDKDIRNAVAGGCRSMRELREELGVASQCGSCAVHARELLRDKSFQCPALRATTPALVAV
jgi:bacterioferritin-associated ferredoxin